MRTTVELRPDQVECLGRYCAENGITQAEAVQRAVDSLLSRSADPEFEAALEGAFGMWKDRNEIDGVEYQRRLRAEWDR
ncbi:MAG: CopG family transcriptional regulator [Dehalococcoidia bacterium]